MNAPYKLRFKEDIQSKTACTKKLSREEVSKFRDAVSKDYYFQMYYDDLPLWGFLGRIDREENKYHLFIHIHFDILYNGNHVIEINLQRDPRLYVDISEEKEIDISFTYSALWEATDIPFGKRMDKFSQYSFHPGNLEIRWLSAMNSCVSVLLLTGCLATILMRLLRKDFIK